MIGVNESHQHAFQIKARTHDAEPACDHDELALGGSDAVAAGVDEEFVQLVDGLVERLVAGVRQRERRVHS